MKAGPAITKSLHDEFKDGLAALILAFLISVYPRIHGICITTTLFKVSWI